MSNRELLLGDEAIALGAIHAGISGAFAYPGTPSTEIFEYVDSVADKYNVSAVWSANEKVAYEEALGMSFSGKRALVSMKHVGLNVAADAFVNSGITGVNGGLVLCVADDPGMHSSQNEQDTRYYARFALVPCLEPVNQQEAYDVTREAFEMSEKHGLPVIIRIVTRLAHSRSAVQVGPQREKNTICKPHDVSQFTLLPSNARVGYRKLTEKQPGLLEASEGCAHNILKLAGQDTSKGIIVNGPAYNYVREAFGGTVPFAFLKVGMYPLPAGKIRQLVDAVDELLVIEEGYPFIEEQLTGVLGLPGKTVHGKYDGTLPRTGELSPSIVSKALQLEDAQLQQPTLETVPGRPPALCRGCGHSDMFKAIRSVLDETEESAAFADIGCYTLGFYPPYNAIESCVDMGASISMALGAAKAGMQNVVCAIGDSTFAHSGMTGLLSAVFSDANMTVFILDNGTVAMTGTQDTMLTGEALVNQVKGLGVNPEHLHLINPLPKLHQENVAVIKNALAHKGLSVVIACRPCVQWMKKNK
jgi:indolepyruvate ferredoxin oxidoreductase, alpha subunit